MREIDKKFSEFRKKKQENEEKEKEPKHNFLSHWKSKRKIKTLETKVEKAKKQEEKRLGLDKAPKVKPKKKKQKITPAERRRRFKAYLEMAGWSELTPAKVSKGIFHATIGISVLLTLYLIYEAVQNRGAYPVSYIFTMTGVIWTIGFVLILLLLWMMFYLVMDLKMFRRKLAVEAVLPDFLQLTSANIRAGMPIDQALWYAIRPRFGILAKEIETVAKETFSGKELNAALQEFASKYDSTLLKRSISLLVEGIDAGGEIGDLLNKIALNIQETRIMKKQMAASVTTYVIFISFATLLAAPVLFALSYQLLVIIKGITGKLASTNLSSAGGLSFSISGDAVALSDFKVFAISTLIMTSFFSAVIVATIRKGSVKEGITFIPVFIVVALLVFFMAMSVLSSALGGIV
ncbi:hypothetical protein D6764_04945 [Candidatus Woesearchaeota archaeon]|nr:MAG: hypothetical protein D6764_04945 [Candidatus Woesearchaeota archaeon]